MVNPMDIGTWEQEDIEYFTKKLKRATNAKQTKRILREVYEANKRDNSVEHSPNDHDPNEAFDRSMKGI